MLTILMRAVSFQVSTALLCVVASQGADLQFDAGEKDDRPPPWKLSTGWYNFSNDTSAADFNLRYTGKSVGNLWLGYYLPDPHGPDQYRAGWDSQFDLGVGRIMPSIQIASGYFLGGSFGVETGKSWFVGAGYGRTNLRPYVNLNFDPNDSYTINVGHRWGDGASASLLWVQDVRLHPDEKHLHFMFRTPLPKGRRITLDVLLKTGLVEDTHIYRLGASFTYDWPRFFVRLAFDPVANFGNEDMLRFTLGTRF